MKCPACNFENRDGAKFYNQCAVPLPVSCGSCGAENAPGAKFCNECATSLKGVSHPTAVTATKAPLSYTRRHLAEKILTSQSAL